MKKIYTFSIAASAISILLGSMAYAEQFNLSNVGANQTTKDVYNWLGNLKNRCTNQGATGVFAGYSGFSGLQGFELAELDDVYNNSGVYPAIIGTDYQNFFKGSEDTPLTNITQRLSYDANSGLSDYWNSGGLVTISVHWPNPISYTGDEPKTELPTAKFKTLDDTSTYVGSNWKRVLDTVAEGLQELEDSGVTVLFRPLHEMNGGWFWWGSEGSFSDERAQVYKDTWVHMYDYFTKTKGLDNLIWVYSPAASRNDKTHYYPGDAYVDIVGLDAYSNEPANTTATTFALDTGDYTEMLTLNKPFAFSEIGPPSSERYNYDYQKWIDALNDNYPEAIYFMTWTDGWSPDDNANGDKLMTNPWSVNRNNINLDEVNRCSGATLYDFESGTNGWIGSNVDSGPWTVTAWSANGSQSLKANVTFEANKKMTLKLINTLDLTGSRQLKAIVKHASWGDPGSGVTAKLYVKIGSNWQWFEGQATSINGSNGTELLMDLSSIGNLNQIKEVGVQFTSPVGSSGSSSLFIDNVSKQ
ncbi:glycosyl hydrolase [Catenovulum sediminis]|uniref:Glycosyl hydrolase n=1 Tax=Catenovulum sediminis TaxID=1740262 RepID=A0ABV1RFS5_9ALTE